MPIGNRFDPVRVAEEYSMIDVISRGRVEMGFVKGVPFEMTPANTNPADLMERFWEAHDLILKAMTTHDGPFNWEGTLFPVPLRSTSGRARISSRIRRCGLTGRQPRAAPARRRRARLTIGVPQYRLGAHPGDLRGVPQECGEPAASRRPTSSPTWR